MFGYVRPLRDELKLRDYDAYRAAYCGLCRAMGRSYGFLARFLVNYDMTFLYLLRASTREEAERRRCHCPAGLCRRETCVCDEEGYEPVAAYNLILCRHKLRDNVRDSGFFRGLPYRLAALALRRPCRRAARRFPAYDCLVREQLARLAELEAEQSPQMDAAADTFARLTAGCVSDVSAPELRRPMEALLYQLGRFIYLTDALDDLAEDCKKQNYNPLRFRFSPREGKLAPADLDYLTQLTEASVNLAGAALELLPMQSHRLLLENVIYLGLPAVFAAVRQGRFQSRKKEPRRKERFL